MDNFRIDVFLELVPLLLVGLFAGIISFFNCNAGFQLKVFIVKCLTSMFICACIYALLDLIQITYMAKIGISAFVGFMGLDTSIGYLDKLLQALRSRGENHSHREPPRKEKSLDDID